jgi:hypothetical protein
VTAILLIPLNYLRSLSYEYRNITGMTRMSEHTAISYTHTHTHKHTTDPYDIQVSQDERTIFWEVIVSVILSKKLYMNMCPIPNGFRDRAILVV